MSTLAIIPARGGSKRLPRKNIMDFHGKPLISWTIESAISSKTITDVIVSTDDEEIAEIAVKYGAQVPFLRPKNLGGDCSTTNDVINHAVNFLGADKLYDRVAILQPTSPLRTSLDIDNANYFFNEKNANAVVSLTRCEHNPEWSNILNEERDLDGFLKNNSKKEYFRLNGAIYIIKTELSNDFNNFYQKGSYGFIMSRHSSVDIDTYDDFLYAEFLMSLNNKYKL